MPAMYVTMRVLVPSVLLLLGASCIRAQEAPPSQEASRRWGLQLGYAIAGAPMGEVAGSFGTFLIPGREYELRLVTRSARGSEWSVGIIADEFSMDHVIDIRSRSQFDYESVGLVVGRAWVLSQPVVTTLAGIDAGWRHFRVSSSRPDYYSGERATSRTTGDAGFVAAVSGLELDGWYGIVQPRLRLEANFPDFGGGDGYSMVHRETDVGFRASVGVSVKTFLIGRGRHSR
jgi:hypothetical protein